VTAAGLIDVSPFEPLCAGPPMNIVQSQPPNTSADASTTTTNRMRIDRPPPSVWAKADSGRLACQAA
jgi:hypothetical protein